ncbi:MAG: glycerate kinase [Armatimonadota bacterium]|nr:glycerate kinase [Armatimonadota bacterium]
MRDGGQLRQHALQIFRAGLRAANGAESVRRALRRDGDRLEVGDLRVALSEFARVWVVGFGKASAQMALAVEEVLGERVDGGVVVTKHGHGVPLRRVQVLEASHPLPGPEGETAARRVVELLQAAGERDLVLCLISGGGSALLPLPAEGLTLQDKVAVTDLLLRSGATIAEVNAVRKHLSAVKGGWLARVAHPARVVGLVVSDVLGNRLDAIASGPFSPDPTTYADALAVLERYGLVEKVPATVRRRLERGAAGEVPETPKPGDPVFQRVRLRVVASVVDAVEAARAEAERLGYHTSVLTTSLEGEAREVGRVVAALAREEALQDRPVPKPACLVLGGETTVTVRGSGRGGRNQELALAAALGLDGLEGVLVASFATDGTDGPTEAAGAFADGSTVARGGSRGLDARRYLAANDSYAFFEALGDLVRTGPTGTNVNDVVLILAR